MRLYISICTRLSPIAMAFSPKPFNPPNQQIIIIHNPIDTFSVYRKSHPEFEIRPNPSITPQRMVGFNLPYLFQHLGILLSDNCRFVSSYCRSSSSVFFNSIVRSPMMDLSRRTSSAILSSRFEVFFELNILSPW